MQAVIEYSLDRALYESMRIHTLAPNLFLASILAVTSASVYAVTGRDTKGVVMKGQTRIMVVAVVVVDTTEVMEETVQGRNMIREHRGERNRPEGILFLAQMS